MRKRPRHTTRVMVSIAFLFFFLNSYTFAQNWCIGDHTYSRDGNGDDRFGYTVAISGNYAIIGSPQEEFDENGKNNVSKAGAVYFYKKNNSGNWEFLQKIVASDRKRNDYFGYSVAISENYAVVGAIGKDNPYDRKKRDVGAVYLYQLGSDDKWQIVKELFASDMAKNAQFGKSVSISGNSVLVGAWKEKEDQNERNSIDNAGAAYLFTRNFFGGWSQAQKIVSPERRKNDYFGESVSISGNTILIGASFHDEGDLGDAGAVYSYIGSFWGSWTFLNKLEPPDKTEKGHFGFSISIFEDQALIGAYGDNKDAKGENPIINAGSASLFTYYANKGWEFKQKVVAENRAEEDRFGWAVSLNSTNAFIGAATKEIEINNNNPVPEAGAVYIFNKSASGEIEAVKMLNLQEPRKGDQWGFSLASSSGSLIVGSPDHDKIEKPGSTVVSNSGAVFLLEPCNDITVNVDTSICNGDSIFLQGAYQSAEGIYYDVYPLPRGNDSIVITNLTVFPVTITESSASVCEGSSIWLGGDYQTEPGIYTDTLIAITGCDSIVITELSVLPAPVTNIYTDICEGDSILLGGAFQKVSGTYFDTLVTTLGCDSVLITELSVNPVYEINLETEICEGESIWLGGAYQTKPGTYYDLFNTVTGCDSLIITELSVLPAPVTNISTQICEGDSILLGGSYRKVADSYYDTLMAATGCDSILITELSVLPVSRTNLQVEICKGESILLGGAYQTEPGTYYDILTASTGCDSIIITELFVLPVPITNLSAGICEGDSVLLGDDYRKEAGMYYDTLQSWNGCDSIIKTELSITPVSRTHTNAEICKGNGIWLGGAYQTEAGTYYDIFTATSGCDSIIITELSVLPPPRVSVYTQICEGDSVLINGEYITKAGIYTDTLSTPEGCDSITITYVTLFPASETRVDATICSGDSIKLGGEYRNISGIYYDTLPSVIGCDSIIATTLVVTQNQSYTITRLRSICRGDSIWLENAYQKTDGVYTDTSIIAPCNDTLFIETTLKINPQERIDLGENATYCLGEKIRLDAGPGFVFYSWNNGSFTGQAIEVETEGLWEVTGTDVNGCTDMDSVYLTFNVCTETEDQKNTPQDIMVYPNPTTDKLTVELPNKFIKSGKDIEIRLFNSLGEIILRKSVQENSFEIDLSSYPIGLYYMNVQNSKANKTIPVILK